MRKELNIEDVIATISGPAMDSNRCGEAMVSGMVI